MMSFISKFKRKSLVIFLISGIAILFSSCLTPNSKEAYLKNFEEFVKRVDKYREDYNKKDWQWADSRFEKYSEIWYKKFEEDLSEKEKLKVLELKLKYASFRGCDSLKRMYRERIKKDLDKAREKLDNYIEEDLDEDVEKIIDGAKEIGDSAVKVLQDFVESIDGKF